MLLKRKAKMDKMQTDFNQRDNAIAWDAVKAQKGETVYHGYRINISEFSPEQVTTLKEELAKLHVKFEERRASTESEHAKAGDLTLRVIDPQSVSNLRHQYFMMAYQGDEPLKPTEPPQKKAQEKTQIMKLPELVAEQNLKNGSSFYQTLKALQKKAFLLALNFNRKENNKVLKLKLRNKGREQID